MRTLIVSDLHLGQRPGHDVLRLAEPRRRLLQALDDVDRLVLLGDIVELTTRLGHRPMAVAEPVLRAIGYRMGAAREIVLVPGNHDAGLISDWALTRGDALGTAQDVACDASAPLALVTSWLAPAQVRVSYPGVWLGDGVWATHGQYLDRHLIPESTFGVPRGRLGHAGSGALAIEYEWQRSGRRRRPAAANVWTSLRTRPLGTLLELTAEMTRYAGLWKLPRALRRVRLASVTTRLLDLQMRHATVPAMAHVAQRLGIDADWIVFGHVHRTGPVDGERWQLTLGGPRLLNTGCWVYEPLLLDRAAPPHPYWPGGAVVLETGREPRALGLLDDLAGDRLVAAR